MASPNKKPPWKAAEPVYGRFFDPWNSSSTGHQRAETRGPQGWRESRTMKLRLQLLAGNTGGSRVSDAVGAGSEDFDEVHRMLVPKEVQARVGNSVFDMLKNPGMMQHSRATTSLGSSSATAGAAAAASQFRSHELQPPPATDDCGNGEAVACPSTEAEQREITQEMTEGEECRETSTQGKQGRKIFDGLVIFVNGYTHPVISDHKLKHILAENGARVAIHLGRRQVTHVILGKPNGSVRGAGGGLAGGKLEKEIRRVGGCGVKFVGVEWVLESLAAGKRLPEARFASLKVAPGSQQSVYGTFSKARSTESG